MTTRAPEPVEEDDWEPPSAANLVALAQNAAKALGVVLPARPAAPAPQSSYQTASRRPQVQPQAQPIPLESEPVPDETDDSHPEAVWSGISGDFLAQ